MEAKEFQGLAESEVARLVRAAGPKVCVFPINGTRRWFMLEHAAQTDEDRSDTYLDVCGRRHIELYRLLFSHGLDTLLTPVFGPDLLERGEGYMEVAARGLAMLASHPAFLTFYDDCDVRVRFYGDYERFFAPTPYAYLTGLYDEVMARTASNQGSRLFFGVCAHDAAEAVAEIAIRYHAEHGCVPDRRALVELYYGEPVGSVDLFIGFDKFCAFDMPLVATGNEDLYFTVSPSPYLTARQLRDILYDHLFARAGAEPDYAAMAAEGWAAMKEFYGVNRDRTLGLGTKRMPEGIWYPLPQVEWPDGFAP